MAEEGQIYIPDVRPMQLKADDVMSLTYPHWSVNTDVLLTIRSALYSRNVVPDYEISKGNRLSKGPKYPPNTLKSLPQPDSFDS